MGDSESTGTNAVGRALGRQPGRLSQQTPLEQLKLRKEHFEAELEKVNAAIEALEANPEIDRVMGLVAAALY